MYRNRRRQLFFLLIASLLLLAGCGSPSPTASGNASPSGNSAGGSAVLAPNAQVIDSTTSQAIASTSATDITFSQMTPQLQSLAAGSVIVAGISPGAPQGLLRKVSSVTQSGGTVVVATAPATFEDAMQDGNMYVSRTLTPNMVTAFTPLVQGVSQSGGPQALTVNQSFTIAINNVPLDASGTIKANGNITVEPSFSFDAKIVNFKLNQLNFTNTTTFSSQLQLTAGGAVTFLNVKRTLATYTFQPITIPVATPVGVFPVIVTPVLTLVVGGDGSISSSLSSDISYTETVTAGLTYANGQWSPVNGHTSNFSANPLTLSANATLKGYTGPQLDMLLYGSAGVTGSIQGYLRLTADAATDPWWSLYGGVAADVGAQMTIFSHVVASYNLNIPIYEKLLLQAPPTPGVTWTPQISGTPNWLLDVVWSGTQFVAVGDYGTILTSPDGVTWTTQTSGTASALWGVVWSGSQFVAVGNGYTILTSPDGVAWTTRYGGGSWQGLKGVAWSGSQFVAVGNATLTSPDGVTWSVQNFNGLFDVVWSGTQFVAVGGSTILTSPDGVTWSAQNSGTTNWLGSVAWSGTQFVAVGSGTILTSPDGVTWTTQSANNSIGFEDITWSGNKFVAVGGPGAILTSPDGVNWTAQNSGTNTGNLSGVAWSGSKFVVVGNGGTILTSP